MGLDIILHHFIVDRILSIGDNLFFLLCFCTTKFLWQTSLPSHPSFKNRWLLQPGLLWPCPCRSFPQASVDFFFPHSLPSSHGVVSWYSLFNPHVSPSLLEESHADWTWSVTISPLPVSSYFFNSTPISSKRRLKISLGHSHDHNWIISFPYSVLQHSRYYLQLSPPNHATHPWTRTESC